MEKVLTELRNKAKSDPKKIAFPEVDDERIIEAVKIIEKEGIAKPHLISSQTIDKEKLEEFSHIYYERRKKRGISLQEAHAAVSDPLNYSAMLVKCGYMDGFIAGAASTTSSVIKAAIRCLDIDQTIGLVSGCFIMIVPGSTYGEQGVFIFSDCAVTPNPGSEQLALIAISAAQFAKEVLGFSPRVAFLSFSTKGSAEGRWVKKIREAVEMLKAREVDFLIDGELQADSALVPEVAKRKLKDSDVAGMANVLIFPNLDAGNICYKLIERLAQAKAIGPVLLGTTQPCGDLSRGCSVEDIIDSTAITVIRAQREK